ncbi:hypothetical protein [Ottowia thiooxydans]|uniref:hypothetical protein n=1 Tax=Ottowia thiooxydans TaxID=219182 RepID=UPI00048BD312|nr:hypothetical protein [Ottowia thiooxydans]
MKKIELIKAFIENELDSSEDGGEWFAMNGHRLKKDVVAAAPQLLSQDELRAFYSLLLRNGLLFEEPIQEHYPDWEAAYRLHTPWMVKKPYQNCSSIHRLQGLCLFGFDYAAAVGVNHGYDDYSLYRQAIAVQGSNIPDILKRAERLVPFADNEKVIERFGAALRGLDFIYDDWYGVTNSADSYSYVNLNFFHVLLTLHLSKRERAHQAIEEYKTRLPSLPQAEEQKALLARCESASKRFNS